MAKLKDEGKGPNELGKNGSGSPAANSRVGSSGKDERPRPGQHGTDVFELEVQRRLTEHLVSGGVPYGRISLEVLYMLPPEFVRAYVDLFWQALGERNAASPSRGGPNEPRDENVVKQVRADWKPKKSKRGADGELLVEGSRLHGAGSGAGGKKYRTSWTIADEAAFKAKGSVDRKLRRLARDIPKTLADARGMVTGDEEIRCKSCRRDLSVLDLRPNFCPSCGCHEPLS